jgi:hypothetical protein
MQGSLVRLNLLGAIQALADGVRCLPQIVRAEPRIGALGDDRGIVPHVLSDLAHRHPGFRHPDRRRVSQDMVRRRRALPVRRCGWLL